MTGEVGGVFGGWHGDGVSAMAPGGGLLVSGGAGGGGAVQSAGSAEEADTEGCGSGKRGADAVARLRTPSPVLRAKAERQRHHR
ncbi:hypothetical protein J7I98_39455 [Streptomyces sp. ISL-98]|uniref:hypothetical protein n=1 Tax=Streptomyces sp. ISL-98 TaxID=2819192 RepID=UPI001BE5BE1B|nr:hypothetical protein [Streptomyces sp. ISL-98]MBT2511743.1 hypothetical protein [Streptomyces sp. ISL-98]